MMALNRRASAITVALISLALSSGVAAQSTFEFAQNVDSVRIVSSGQNFTPRQSVTAGGAPRHTSDYELVVTWEPMAWRAHEEWSLLNVYPAEQLYSFTMTYEKHSGLTIGSDGRALTPETRPMGAARIGANFKQLVLTNPLILAADAEADSVSAVKIRGRHYDQARLTKFDTQWNLLIDPADGLPVQLTTTELDQWGQTEHRVTYGDWREVSGVPFPYRVEQYLDDKLYRREVRSSISVNPSITPEMFDLAGLDPVDSDSFDWGWSMSHFFLARAGLANPQDYFDTFSISFHEVADDVFHIMGSEGHHNLAIIGPEGIAIVDAPWLDRRSEEVIAELRRRWPDKPIKYVILTHHHIDHSGGFMAYVREGATLVVGDGSAEFFAEALRAAGYGSTSITAVEKSAALGDIGRNVEVYDVANSHADATLIAYVPDERLGFTTDIFSPGREWQLPFANAELLAAVEFHGIDVERFVGGHGQGTAHPND